MTLKTENKIKSKINNSYSLLLDSGCSINLFLLLLSRPIGTNYISNYSSTNWTLSVLLFPLLDRTIETHTHMPAIVEYTIDGSFAAN